MKTLNEILSKKTAVFCYGRMNPPTRGHEKLINKVLDVAKKVKGTPFIFPTASQDAKKNPLSFSKKIQYLKMSMRNARSHIVSDLKKNTLFGALEYLTAKGYTDIIVVAGSDRVSELKNVITPYIAHPDAKKSINIDSFDVVSSGERDPNSDDVSGTSGAMQREFAKRGDFTSFYQNSPSGLSKKYAKELYNDVRNGMKIYEQLDEQIKKITNSLNIPRAKMPQISKSYINSFIDFIRGEGIKVKTIKIAVSKLKPTQNEINLEKVKSRYEYIVKTKDVKPFIISNDYHILDGHHQLFALYEIDKNMKIECQMIDYPMLGIIEYAKKFPKTTYKSINEDSEVSRVRERQKRELELLKAKHFDELQDARERDFAQRQVEKSRNESDEYADDDLIYEYLEDGTDEIVRVYKSQTPGEH